VLERIFDPQSIAIIGASKKETKYGRLILNNMIHRFSMNGKHIYPIHLTEKRIMNIDCYSNLRSLPEIPDLAVICLNAETAVQIVKEAGEIGVKGVIIISSGFKEIGNVRLENKINEYRKECRVIGPNCLGIYDAYTGVDTLFPAINRDYKPDMKNGNISLISQSGALGVDLMLRFHAMKLYLSKFVSYGNASDLNETDFLEFLGKDSTTKVIGMYLEDIKAGRKFVKVARSTNKPIVVFKIGNITEGNSIAESDIALAAASHTGSLAGDARVYKAVFKEAGVIAVNNTHMFIDALKALSFQKPAMRDGGIAIVSNVGGPATLALHHCTQRGLSLAELSEEGESEIELLLKENRIDFLPLRKKESSKAIAYIDLTGSANSEVLTSVCKIMLDQNSVNGLIFFPRTDAPAVSRDTPTRLAMLKRDYDQPVVLYNLPDPLTNSTFEKYGFPVFNSPENAVDGMVALVSWGRIIRERNR